MAKRSLLHRSILHRRQGYFYLATRGHKHGLFVGNYIDGDFLKRRDVFLIHGERIRDLIEEDAFIENARGDR